MSDATLIQLDDVQGDYAEGRDDGYRDGFTDGREAGIAIGIAMGRAIEREQSVAYFERLAIESTRPATINGSEGAALALRMQCHVKEGV